MLASVPLLVGMTTGMTCYKIKSVLMQVFKSQRHKTKCFGGCQHLSKIDKYPFDAYPTASHIKTIRREKYKQIRNAFIIT